MRYEELIESVGSNGRFQKRLYVLFFLATIPNGLTVLLTVFTHFAPPYHCKLLPDDLNMTMNGTEYSLLQSLLLPIKDGEFDQCHMYNVSVEQMMDAINSESSNGTFRDYQPIKCPYGYIYHRDMDGLESAVTEFNMVCDRAWLKPLMTSLYMAGMGIGSLSGKISDIYGRRAVFLFFTYACFIAVGLTGAAWDVASYGFFMFIGGLSQLVNFVVAFVISCEFMNVEDRGAMSLGPFMAFSTGYVLSALVGYLILNWRWLLLFNGLLGLLFIPYYWLIPESPRWLITKGRIEDAVKVLEEVAKINGKKVNVREILESGVTLSEKDDGPSSVMMDKETLLNFIKIGPLRNRFLSICFAWFVTSLVYYTISLNTSGLAGNRFINCVLAAAVELPAYYGSYLCVKHLGRPSSLATLMIVSGTSCIIAPFLTAIHPILTMVVAMIGKFAITATFFIVYFYSAELVPTLLRNFCVGLGSFSARISGFIAPYMIYAGESLHESIPFVMMGSMALLCALFTVLWLPETRGIPMPDSIQDALDNKRYIRICYRKKNDATEEEKKEINL